MNVYQKIDGSKYQNIYVVGDLHGCYGLLETELAKVKFNRETDLLISVGDLIDRGEQNLECLRLLREPWFAMVRGNHDQMAIQALLHHDAQWLECWYGNGGNWFGELSSAECDEVIDLLKLCQNRPLVIELSLHNEKVVIAHADYPHNHYEFNQAVNTEAVQWNRTRLLSKSETDITGAKGFIFGHTILNSPEMHGNCLYIDTGAFRTGNLTLVRLE